MNCGRGKKIGEQIFPCNVNFRGKWHDFKEIFLGEGAYVWLLIYNEKSPGLLT